MQRKLEVVDVLVAIGMVATLLGGYLLFKASYGGALAVATPTNQVTNPPMKLMVQAMLQPAIGQAIVDHAVLERQFASDVLRGASKLYQATLATEHHPIGGLDTIEARAAQFKADHEARVQHVMGKIIVNLTHQGVRAGVISADNLSNKFNERIISTAKTTGDFMKEAFANNWQPRLGQWIVSAAKKERAFAGHVQERLGQATVQLATTQHEYLTKREEIQNQLEALVAAAARTNAQTDLFARLARADANMQQALGIQSMPTFEVVEARTLPEIPIGYMLAAFTALVGVFLISFTFPTRRHEPEDLVERIQNLRKEMYRKVA
jgi:hypothetical protein